MNKSHEIFASMKTVDRFTVNRVS